jgi:putative nucleotidyltransferase with HDIG domain
MRDFTVNAMAYDPIAGVFLDPHGGADDLRALCLRAAGDPDARFREDPLRPMRAARFAARFGFRIERRTRRAMGRHVPAFRRVAQERIGAELGKILISAHPRYGLEILRRSGHLEVFLPELLEGLGMRQNRWHRYDVYHHVLRAVQAAAPELVVRLAVLLHDIDKPRTVAPSEKRQGEFTFYGHEVSGAERAYAICRRLRFSQKIAQEVQLLVREHQFLYTDEWSDAAVRRMLARVGGSFDRLLLVREADVRGHGVSTEDGLALLRSLEVRARKLLEARPALQAKDLAIGGREVMEALGIGPSPVVGEALRHLLELVLEEPAKNEAGALLEALRGWEPAPTGG